MDGTADKLLNAIDNWVDLQKQSVEKLNSLATELMKHKKNVNISKVVGSSVSVGAAAAMTAAGILSIITGGLAIPVLAVGGAVASGLALANNVGSEVASAVISSRIMKEANTIADKIKIIENTIQELAIGLTGEGPKRTQAPSCEADFGSEYVMEQILRAMAKQEGLMLHESISLLNMTSLPKHQLFGKDAGFSVLQSSALGLPLISKLVTELVTVGPKAAVKAAGRVSIKENGKLCLKIHEIGL